MLKPLKNKSSLLVGSGLLGLALIGTIPLAPKAIDWMEQRQQAQIEKALQEDSNKPSVVLTLAEIPSEQRRQKLEEIAASDTLSLERSRARYLLAVDLLKKYEGGPALRQLEGLENEYPVLAPLILLKRGRGYELTNEKAKAQETWQELVKTYPESLIAAEALVKLGQSDPSHWDEAIAKFPQHPGTQEIIRERLTKNPQQPELLLLLAKYDKNNPATNPMRDRLVKDYASQLTPEDWQAIADGYWAVEDYYKAALAYQKAPSTAQNLYRIGRGQQLQPNGNNKATVQAAYQKLLVAFPQAPEAALALQRLAQLSQPETAISYLDQLINKFPEQAGDALVKKAELLDKLNRQGEATKIRQTLLSKYAKSDATAEYRWLIAQKAAERGDALKAWTWAQPIVVNNPESPLAPKAGFWVGKWAQQLGRLEEAETAFEYVVTRHPQSYYAWRSAVQLGWNVGNFNTIRQTLPQVAKPTTRSLPPAGSAMFQELYRLGQDREAITLFQAEMSDRAELDVNESFTDALLKLVQGKNLVGINQVWDLKKKEELESQEQWQKLRETPEYWHALFPFPFYQTIMDWSQKRQLNPLLVTSLIRQESRFEPEIASPVGAKGLMQVMPATGEWVANKIQLKNYSLSNPNDNVNLGTWYLNHTHDTYSNNSLLAVASYNAGPGNVSKWVKRYQTSDPDVFVEKIPFKETKGYVESVFGNYWNYLRIYNPDIAQLLAQKNQQTPK
ncbi:Lytic transglycosylase catalytic [Rippkaea orientalis PCC 8801]|uniref:Lytic transglycosylase catalytic n=1 Tax=Rippkaea orientalis (strain PCC 8801 / RF-1) TaxID=41431 RepID=B7K2M8_RIPO1|nr:transglycosylase SLT domain-containing protein [Rippkaea orientalis]ACK66421.1 Lytic transglycosylase catalytic [Rippkaea orientalis PCC 8801]